MKNLVRLVMKESIVVLLILLSTAAALAGFKNNELLAYDGNPLIGDWANVRMAWNPVSGRLGMAYMETKPAGRAFTYVEWKSGSVVSKEYIGASGNTVLGLAYDASGLPRAGMTGTSSIFEYVKQAGGTWVSNDTGISPDNEQNGAYAINPSNGTGAFLINTKLDAPRKQLSYIYYQENTWKSSNCDVGGFAGASLAFTQTGTPFAIWGNDIPPVNSGAMGRVAGDITPGATNFQEITGPDVNKYLSQEKVAVDPTNGEIWVAYVAANWGLYCRKWTDKGWSAPETIDVGASNFNGAQFGFAISPSHDKAVLYSVSMPGDGRTGLNMAYWDHTKGAWAVESLPTEGECNALDLVYDDAGNLYGLYSNMAGEKFYLLSEYTPPMPLYMKITMINQAEPVVIHIWPQLMDGTFTSQANIWNDGIVMDETMTRFPENIARMLKGNQSTGWIDLTPFKLSPYGDNKIQLLATQEWMPYDPGFSPSNYKVEFANEPDDTKVFKTFTRTGSGSGMVIVADLSKRDEFKDDVEYSKWQNDFTRALPATPGKRPTKFPIKTLCYVPSTFFQSTTVQTEIDTLTRLGFNDIDRYDPIWFDAGFKTFSSGSNYRFPPMIINDDRSNPDPKAIAEFIKPDVTKAIATGHLDKITLWTLYDEPSSMSMEHIAGCPVCAEKFRLYLQGLKYKPQDFGKTSWDRISPTLNKTAEAKLFYHTAMFRCQILVDLFKVGTNALKKDMPNVPTTANFVEEITYSGNMLFSGVDQFAMFEQEALRLGWSGTWLPWTSTRQVTGHVVDFMRSAVGDHGTGKFGMYNMRAYGKIPWDNACKKISEVGHGAQQITDYNWGPYYAISVDQGSQRTQWYTALQTANLAIGAVEDYLVDAKVPKSKVAFLYSQATDIWALDSDYSLFGQENVGLWLLLRHLGYPVDFVQEKDVAAGKLTKDNYKMVICNASNLLKTALPPLVSWLKAGGVLYMGPGALSSDQYNAPLGFDAHAGISRQAFVYKDNPSVATYFYSHNDLMPVSYGNEKLEALCGYQKMKSTPAGAKVLATFADGSPAVFTKSVGKGQLQFSGFFPGLGYEKAGMITLQQRDRIDPDYPTQGPTEWPEAHRALFDSLLKQSNFRLPVTTSNYLVEADRLEAPATHPGSLIAITNWTGKPLTNVTITLPRNGMLGVPTTVINPITSQITKDGMLTVTMDIKGPVDFLVVPKK